jgi:hypothetical protein
MHMQFIFILLITILHNPHIDHKHIMINQQMYGHHTSVHLRLRRCCPKSCKCLRIMLHLNGQAPGHILQ